MKTLFIYLLIYTSVSLFLSPGKELTNILMGVKFAWKWRRGEEKEVGEIDEEEQERKETWL